MFSFLLWWRKVTCVLLLSYLQADRRAAVLPACLPRGPRPHRAMDGHCVRGSQCRWEGGAYRGKGVDHAGGRGGGAYRGRGVVHTGVCVCVGGGSTGVGD